MCGFIPLTRSELAYFLIAKVNYTGRTTVSQSPIPNDLFSDKLFRYNQIYVPHNQTTLRLRDAFEQNLDYSRHPLSHYHCAPCYQCTSKSSACLPVSDFMKLVKKINQAFIALIVGLLYVFGIGFAWILHITSKRTQPSTDSFWKIPDLKKLPKHYFSSPY